MSTDPLDPAQVVSFVIDAQKRLGDEAQVIAALASLGMTNQRAKIVVETVEAAAGRAFLLSLGMKPGQFHGDLETDPLFQAALARFPAAAKTRTAKPVGPSVQVRRPWWRFWSR